MPAVRRVTMICISTIFGVSRYQLIVFTVFGYLMLELFQTRSSIFTILVDLYEKYTVF